MVRSDMAVSHGLDQFFEESKAMRFLTLGSLIFENH